ncbi:hypothetical protein EsH8_IX_000393 [Colletotrichum jinshuiense]
MYPSTIAFLSSVLASLASAECVPLETLKAPYCPPKPVSREQQRLILEEFVHKTYIERNVTKGLLDHMAEDYIQHSPSVLSGRDEALQALSWITPGTVNFTVRHLSMDGDLAWVYSRIDVIGQTEPTAGVDILRFNGSCIQEHWDVQQTRPANRTNTLDMW